MPTRVRIEFKREDCWMGAYWRRTEEVIPDYDMTRTAMMFPIVRRTLDVWICLVPMLPLHFTFADKPTEDGNAR